MSERSRNFKWTWVLNIYSLFFLAFGAPAFLRMLVEDTHYVVRLGDYLMIGCAAALAGLWLYSRCRGSWRAIQPPPGVSLFWVFVSVLTLAVSLFVR